MSRFIGQAVMYDCLDQVKVIISIREELDHADAPTEWEHFASTTIRGEGVTDRRAWLQDALIAALEAL